MIIDARTFLGSDTSRPYTFKGAVIEFMDGMEAGTSERLDAAYDKYGRPVPINRVQAYMSQHAGQRKFSTRTIPDGSLCHIYRLA